MEEKEISKAPHLPSLKQLYTRLPQQNPLNRRGTLSYKRKAQCPKVTVERKDLIDVTLISEHIGEVVNKRNCLIVVSVELRYNGSNATPFGYQIARENSSNEPQTDFLNKASVAKLYKRNATYRYSTSSFAFV